jgi:hypothetical protein
VRCLHLDSDICRWHRTCESADALTIIEDAEVGDSTSDQALGEVIPQIPDNLACRNDVPQAPSAPICVLI